jgi:putative ABC transport system substrate-binding protein
MDRRRFLLTALAALTTPIAAEAQSGDKLYRIGVLSPTAGRNPLDDALEKRLGDLGWSKGRNVSFSYRYSRVNDALPVMAKELVRERVDIIVTTGTPASLAAKEATTTIPIVFYSVGDPVGVHLVSNLGRPGRNVTGISGITYQLGAKRLELLKELLPEARLVGILLNPTDPTSSQVLGALKAGLGSTNVTVGPFYAGIPAEIEAAFQAMKRRGVSGVVVQPDGMFWAQRPSIVKLAADLRVPTIYAFNEDVEAGGLMSYGADILDMQAQAVTYVDRILRGSLPADLPVLEPTKVALAINLKTAKTLGLTIPPSLLLRAHHVIE